MKNTIIFIIALITLFPSFAVSPQEQLRKLVNPMVVELERKVAQDLILESQFYLSNRTYKIETNIEISFSKLMERYNYNRISKIVNEDTLGFDLVNKNEIFEQQFKNVGISQQELAAYVQSITIDILIDKEPDPKVKAEVEKLINQKIKKMTEVNPTLSFKVLDLPQAETNNIKDIIKETAQDPQVQYWFEVIVVILGALFILSMFVLILSLRKQADQIQKAVGQIQIQMPDMKVNFPKEMMQNKDSSSSNNQPVVISSGDKDQYSTLLNNIREILQTRADLRQDFAAIIQNENNYEAGLILRELSTEEDFQKLMGAAYSKKFTEFMRQDGINILADQNKMIKLAQDIYQTLKTGAMDASLLIYSSLVRSTKKLDTDKLTKILKTLSTEEKSLLLSIANPLDVAMAIQSMPELVREMKSQSAVESVDPKVTKSLAEKLKAFVQKTDTSIDPLSEIASYLPSDLANSLFEQTGKGEDKNFLASKKDVIFAKLNDLALEDLALVLAVLPTNIKDEYIKTLPDIKASRLKSRKFEVTERSLVLKHELLQSIKGA